MSKHTQGPWWRDDDGFIAAGSGDSYVTIADFDCSDLDIDEREANKALAIAAPELLEQLKLARSMIVSQATMLSLFGKVEDSPFIADMDAVIAKAESA